jgi:hypothetical protein
VYGWTKKRANFMIYLSIIVIAGCFWCIIHGCFLLHYYAII